MKAYLQYEEYREGGQVCEGQENDAWPSYEDEFINFTPLKVFSTQPTNCYTEEFDISFKYKPGDTIYLVIPRYFSGGTFGRTCGYWKIYGAFKTRKAAEKLQKELEEENKSYIDDKWQRRKGKATLKNFEYREWHGYFEGLENVEIHEMRLT